MSDKEDDFDEIDEDRNLLEILGAVEDDLDSFLQIDDNAELAEMDADAILNPPEIKDLAPEIEQLHKVLSNLNHFELFRISNHITNSIWELVNTANLELESICSELIDEISRNKFLITHQKTFLISIVSYFVDQGEFSGQELGKWLLKQESLIADINQLFWRFADELVKIKYLASDIEEKRMAAGRIILAEGYYTALLRENSLQNKNKLDFKPKTGSSRPLS